MHAFTHGNIRRPFSKYRICYVFAVFSLDHVSICIIFWCDTSHLVRFKQIDTFLAMDKRKPFVGLDRNHQIVTGVSVVILYPQKQIFWHVKKNKANVSCNGNIVSYLIIHDSTSYFELLSRSVSSIFWSLLLVCVIPELQ